MTNTSLLVDVSMPQASPHPLDRHIQAFLDQINAIPPVKVDIETGRKLYLEFVQTYSKNPLPVKNITNIKVYGSSSYSIPIRIYNPSSCNTTLLPVLMYIHGGGWERGNLDTHDSICRYFSYYSGCIVVSVDWRVAPEHKFPIGIGDCFDVYQWILKNGHNFSMNISSIGIGGDSAGGNLATAVFQRIEQNNIEKPKFQLLLYPSLDLSCSAKSYEDFSTGYFLSTEHVKDYISNYLPCDACRDDPLASPILKKDLHSLPKTHIIYAGYDPLRGDSEIYIEKLTKAGIDVTSKCYETMIHAFLHMDSIPAVVDALKEIAEVIKESLVLK